MSTRNDPSPAIESSTAELQVAEPQADKRYLSNKALAGIMAGYVGLGLIGGVELAQARATVASSPECPAPSTADMKTVTELFNKPAESPVFKPDMSKYERAQAHNAFLKSAQDKSELTFYNATPLERSFEVNNQGQYIQPFNQFMVASRTFLAKYGVTLELLTADQQLKLPAGVTPNANQLETDTAKQTLLNIDEGVSELPVELVKKVGWKHIILGTDLLFQDGNGADAYALTGNANDTIVFGVDDSNVSSDVIDHEFSHLTDAVLCGGADKAGNDPAYTAKNGTHKYAMTFDSHKFDAFVKSASPSYETLQTDLYKSWNGKLGFTVENCKMTRKLHALGGSVAFDSDYAEENQVEDKAQMLRDIFYYYDYQSILDPSTPILRNKALTELARLGKFDPALVHFYAAVAKRPQTLAEACADTVPPHIDY